ncbi:twin-arginine translocase subunit TatC [bacterium SCSIO 12741]|nr:twin-arginine translocase subunit TatC [bacterium SCSIO 12741]
MAEQKNKEIGVEEEEMSFLDHLEILRWHLVRSAAAIILFGLIAFFNKKFLFDEIIFGPKSSDFITFRALCWFSAKLQSWLPFLGGDLLCIGQNLPELRNMTMAGQFTTHIMVSLIAGLIVAIPYVLWEAWRFIGPGLNPSEKNYSRGGVFFTSVLFLSGVAFGYFVISPLSVNFFMNYSVSENVLNTPTLSTYISTVTTVVLACGVVFQLPIIVYFLTKLGILSPLVLKKYRRHAFAGSMILSAFITPPDVFSQLLVTVPLVFLYEISIFISRRVTKTTES